MKVEIFTYSLLLCLTILSCNTAGKSDSELIETIWTHHRSFGKENDTLYLKLSRSIEKTDFVYYENQKDSFGIMLYSILKNKDLVFFRTDTLKLSESSFIVFNNDSLRLLKYEYPDPLPGGMGCLVFAEEIGLLGMGVYVGEKKLLIDWNQMNIEEDVILKKMKWKRTEIPSPPPNVEK
jgi:hypothetical protein